MKTINTPELIEWQKQNKKIRIIDVRTECEYNEGAIKNSELIPLDVLDRVFAEKLTDKDEIIVCVCRSGGRSSMAVDFLNNQGYSNVYNLIGGYTMYKLFAV